MPAAATEPVPCEFCRAPLAPTETLEFRGRLACEPCVDTQVRLLKMAEAISAEPVAKPRAA